MSSLDMLPWKRRAPAPTIGKDERLIAQSHHHWMKFTPSICVYVFLMILSIITLVYVPSLRQSAPELSTIVFWCVLLAMVIVQHWFFHAMLSENTTTIILTNKRILYLENSLWVDDAMDELVLKRIQMVKVHKQGVIRHMLNYGELSCFFDVDAGKTFRFMPGPQTWARQIENLMNVG